mmetsp:Transcript_44763/g.108121  ORF Transcript_44763/g.108121 Transcript_44763/m.108121 type:complete len:2401 (-) Transcript_44763:79-7281(-)
MMRRSRYETREETRETIIRGRYRESYVPKAPRIPPKKQPQDKSRQQKSRPRSIFQQQRDELSTSSTEKSSLYTYNTDHDSSQHTQQTQVRTNLSKPSLFDIAESSGATLAAAAISPFDEDRRGSREHPQRSFFEEHDDDLRESPSDELPLHMVEKAIDKVLDATCGNVTATSGALAGNLLTRSYLEAEAIILGEDGIIDPTIPNPFEGLRQEVRPVYEAASFPKVTFREVKLDPKKTVASTALQYPEPLRPMIKPKIKIPNKTSAAPTKTKSPIRSMANRVKSVQNKLFRRRNRPIQESSTKKAEYLDDKRASKLDRYTRARAHSDASGHSRSRANHRRRPLDSQESQEDTSTKSYSTSTNESVPIALALHECPSVRECPANQRTNRARHNRSTRRRMQSDETDTSDPSLPPRLPLHKNRLRSENPSDELSGARHCRTVGVPSTDGYSSVDPYSSVEKSGSGSDSSSSSVSNALIPQVNDYILPHDGSRPQPDITEQISELLQEQATQVERIAIIRERRIQSDPTTTVDEIGKRPDPPTMKNETTALRKTIKRRRAVSEPNPLSHYQRMAQFFVPVLYRVLSKYQQKSLEFQQETETALVPRCSPSQAYVLSELVNIAILLIQQNNSETVTRADKESRRKRRRRRRKRSSVLDELCSQISVLDQKLLEITNDTDGNNIAAIEDENPILDQEETPFIEPIDDWSEDDAPPEVEGSLDEENYTELFGGLQRNDPDFKDLIEMAYVVTDLSRDEFIDAHHTDSMKDDEDDDLERELTNLSFVEEIIQTELSQVDSGEGTYQDASVVEESIHAKLSEVDSGDGTYQDGSFVEEIFEPEVLPADSSEGTYQTESVVEEIVETQISQGDSSDGTYHEEPVVEEIIHTELSKVESGEATYEDESVVQVITDNEVSHVASSEGNRQEELAVMAIIEKEVSQVYSREGIHQENWMVEDIVETEVSQDCSAKGTFQEESVTDVTVEFELENKETKEAALPVVAREMSEISKKLPLEAGKESLWEDDMFPDDELQEDANMFPDDEMITIDQAVEVAAPINAILTSTAMSRPEQKCEEARKLREDEDLSFLDLLSLPSDEREAVPKSSTSDVCPNYVATAPKKERSSFKETSVTLVIEGKGEQFASKISPSSRFTTRNKTKKEALSPAVAYIPRAKEAETLSSDVDYIPKEREVVSPQPDPIVPSGEEHDYATVESTPSDEASEDVEETGSIGGGELADTPKETELIAPETSVVECIDDKTAADLVVSPESPVSHSKETIQQLETVCSCETEESDPICAAVNRKLAEVRLKGIPDPDDEMIMETIGMSMSMNSASKTPRSTASDVVPDPDDDMIIETILSPSESLRRNDKRVESDADNKIVMETVYLAESEMVTEKLFTVSEEGTTSSSPCNASRQASTLNETDRELQEREDAINGQVRAAIMKFNGGGNPTGSSHKEAGDAQTGEPQSQKDNHIIGSQDDRPAVALMSSPSSGSHAVRTIQRLGKNVSPRQQSKPSGRKPKGVAAALIARFEASVGPKKKLGVHPVVLKEEDDMRASSRSTRNAPACDAPATGEIETAIERSEPSYLNEPNSFAAQPTNEGNSPLAKPPSEPRQEAIHDEIPSLLSASSESQPEVSKGQGQLRHSPSKSRPSEKSGDVPKSSESQPEVSKGQGKLRYSPSKSRPSGKSGDVPKSPSKGVSKKSSKVNQLRSQFETKLLLKNRRPTDVSPSKLLGYKNAATVSHNEPKKASKLQSKAPTNKQLPLHGFVKAASKKDESKQQSLIDKVKPPVHQPSRNFSSVPLDFEELNESLLQIRREEKKEQGDGLHEHQDDEDMPTKDNESTQLPFTELQLKEVASSVSELEGPRVKMFSRGMCNCLGAVEGKSSDDDTSISLLKKVGRRKKDVQPIQKEVSNLDEFVPPVFSMDAKLDDNMQRTADAAVKALELVLAKGAANAATAAAAITQNENQASCLKDCMTPVTEGSFNAFSQAVIQKPGKKQMIKQGNDNSLTLEDEKSKARKDSRKDTKVKSKSKENDRLPRKKAVHNALALTDINEDDDNDDWARTAIQENNVDDLIELLRSKSSELDPFMTVSFEPSTPTTKPEYLSRVDAPVSPISNDWTGSAGRLGVQPMSAAQRDAWSKRNLLSGTTTFSSEDSDYHLQPHRQQYEDGRDFDARQVDIDFHFESPAGSIRGPYDRMIKEQARRGRTPTSRTQNRSVDPPSGRWEQNDVATSTGKREPTRQFENDYYNYTYMDQNGNVKQPKQERPDYYDFPAPPSQEISELTMSQEGDMALTLKSQDPVKALKSFQEMENRVGSSCEWLYDSKRGATRTTAPSSRSARTATAEHKFTVDPNKSKSSSSMWCSESLGFMIQDCFATSSQPAATKAIKGANKVATPERRKRAPDAPSMGQ